MVVIDGRTWLEVLTVEQCWEHLGAEPVGRIGVLVDSAPEIYPVNHVVDHETVVFRTSKGDKLRGLERSPSVCFEVDGHDASDHTGWSVLVKGTAVEVVDSDELSRLVGLELVYWALGEKAHWIRIRPREVTGRRIHHRPAPAR